MSSRKPAPRLAKPAVRYWQGKAPKGVSAEVNSDSEEDVPLPDGDQDIVIDVGADDGEDEDLQMRRQPLEDKSKMSVTLRNVNISKEGRVIVDGKEESGKTLAEQEQEQEESEAEERPSADANESSSEYETDSEDGVGPTPVFRPVFVPKRGRETVLQREAEALDLEEAIRRKEQAAEERRKQSHDMVAESIKRELAEKETPELIPDVDDTDGLDPEAEFEAWRLRELGRIKRDKEAEVLREEARLEIERRRAMPEDQRLKEDLERANKSREEKPKGQQKFLQKYWHKGAFHQDADILKRHDFTEATESTVDVTLLPKVMQVKNFGKRSRTKYTHLVDQDTSLKSGGFGGTAPIRKVGDVGSSEGCFNCGGPHLKRDCPNMPNGPRTSSEGFGTGANKLPTAPRQWDSGNRSNYRSDARQKEVNDTEKSRESWPRDQEPRSENRRVNDRGNWHSRSRSRSRSPYQRREYDRRRPRDGSPPLRESKKQRLD